MKALKVLQTAVVKEKLAAKKEADALNLLEQARQLRAEARVLKQEAAPEIAAEVVRLMSQTKTPGEGEFTLALIQVERLPL